MDNSSAFSLGMIVGWILTLLCFIMLHEDKLKNYSISHGFGGYDQINGEYVMDSLVKLNDTTLIIKKH
jgi:hypothetical protein